MNDELADYWNKSNDASRRNEAIQAGRKRSVKDRLGELKQNAVIKVPLLKYSGPKNAQHSIENQ